MPPGSNGRLEFAQRVLHARANRYLALEDKPLFADVTPHGLRYTPYSLLIAQAEDVATVAAPMWHSDPTTTLRSTRVVALPTAG